MQTDVRQINGATIIFLHRKEFYTFHIEAFLTLGSWNESKSNQGISHFLEHCIVKGQKGEILSKNFLKKGGTTYPGRTRYWWKCPSTFATSTTDFALKSLINPQLLDIQIQKERQAIRQELSDSKNDPIEYLNNLIDQHLSPPHSQSSNNLLGTIESLNNITGQQIRDWHQEHYHSSNMFFVVSGNFNQSELEQLFSKNIPVTNLEPIPIPAPDEIIIQQGKFNGTAPVQKSIIKILFPLPNLFYEKVDQLVFCQYLENQLCRGELSFQSVLRGKLGMVYDSQTYIDNYNQKYFLTVKATCEDQFLEPMETAIKNHWREICTNHDIPRSLLDKVDSYIEEERMACDNQDKFISQLSYLFLKSKTLVLPESLKSYLNPENIQSCFDYISKNYDQNRYYTFIVSKTN